MLKVFLVIMSVTTLSSQALADPHFANGSQSTIVTDITDQYVGNAHSAIANDILENSVNDLNDDTATTPSPNSPAVRNAGPAAPKTSIGGTITSALSQVSLDQLVTLGEKAWSFVLDNKPVVQFQTVKSSIVPNGITDWTQLSGWQQPVSKVYHVQFKNAFGGTSGSFDYRISFIPGGSYQSHGKFLGEIEFTPMNIKLSTGRNLTVTAELSQPLNFGTQADPVAGAQLTVSWTSPTLTRYQMQSADYFIYGNGQVQDLSAGTP